MTDKCSPWLADRRIIRSLPIASGALLDRQTPPGCRTFNCRSGFPHLPGLQRCLLIVEVLSPSTENYDRGKKFQLYRTVPGFPEDLLVHQDRRHVEYYSKQDDGSWLLREHVGPEATIVIARLNVDYSARRPLRVRPEPGLKPSL